MNVPKLGRLIEFDDRSRNFSIRKLLGANRPLRSYTWRCGSSLNQQQEGACVGFAWTHELIARPKEHKHLNDQDAVQIYRLARTLDPWPGENYEGTSVLAGVKAVQRKYNNLISEYKWAFGIDDVLQTLAYKGPLVLGIDWFEKMFEPNSSGIISASGNPIGGHAILANGIDPKKNLIRLHNSWGPSWGFNGDCFISFQDLDFLLKRGGEACIPINRK
jgi:hypothetical protein